VTASFALDEIGTAVEALQHGEVARAVIAFD
jgi:hypothetical protein